MLVILILHYISEVNIVLFTTPQLFDNFMLFYILYETNEGFYKIWRIVTDEIVKLKFVPLQQH